MKLTFKLGIGGAALSFMGIMIGWVVFPLVFKSQIKAVKHLAKGSEGRDLWAKLPFPLDFKIYLFNVTNPMGIDAGENPILREIGPYVYDLTREKVNLVDHEDEDSVEYNQRNIWIFNPAKSKGLTGDEELVFPHLAMMASVMFIQITKPSALGVIGKAMDSVFKKPQTLFVKAAAKDIMFEGLPIDCNVSDFPGSTMCSVMKTKPMDFKPVGDNRYLFSLFGGKNGSYIDDVMKVYRGKKNIHDVGRVISWKNQTKQDLYYGDQCNAMNGTDSTIFPPFVKNFADLDSYSWEICRTTSAHYEYPTKIKGIKTNHYTVNFGDMSTVPEEKCYCPTPDTCLRKGMHDMLKCVGVPIVATLPHWYLADPIYMNNVTGMHPSKDEHEMFLDFEPISGSPIKFAKRLQFNMFVHPVPKVRLMKTFPTALFPLFWVEESAIIPDDILADLKLAFALVMIVRIMKWLMLLGGMGLIGTASWLEFKRRYIDNKLEITSLPKNVVSSAKKNAEDKKWHLNVTTLQPAAVPSNLDGN